MGVMSRRVVPACSTLCYFCPALRARSRQPVKRYKKLLAEIFQLPPDGEPNDRRISKLCDYVSRNPTRIPKITEYLEQRCYKELRHGNFPSAKVVPCIYRKLLASCKEQMSLLATSSLSIACILLDQTLQDDLRVLGCLMLVLFINNQVDSTYMFNLEGLIPKLCQLGQELRGDGRGLRLRSAALQALASMVQFMGDYSHISMEFDDVVSVIMRSYEANQTLSIKEVVGLQDDDDLAINGSMKVLSVSGQNSAKVAADSTMAAFENPAYWARICLHNMANIAKEATTMRRVLDPLFRFFDSHDCWSPDNGIALSVLQEMQILMDKSGQNSHLLLSFTIKHLDHKSVAKQPIKQINIIKVASHLAKHVKPRASLALSSAISDLLKHLRKCMHSAIEASDAQVEVDRRICALHSALEECLIQQTEKVGDVGPLLDMVAVMLENLSHTATGARTTISSVYRMAQIASSVYKSLYHDKVFPEALFHQLLLAMMHHDNKTRIGSHRILSVILAPSVLCPWSAMSFPIPFKDNDPREILLLALSAFSSQSTMNELGSRSVIKDSFQSIEKSDSGLGVPNGNQQVEADIYQRSESPSLNEYHLMTFKDEDLKFMKLSNHQVGLLLSSIWNQASLEDNTPSNYEAFGHTYSLVLLCSKTKNSSHLALVRCFQLALSLRSMAVHHENILQPSRRRSLYTLALAMLIFSAKAGDVPQIIPLVKSNGARKNGSSNPCHMNSSFQLLHALNTSVDPHLCLIDDQRLVATSVQTSGSELVYGSEEDEIAASSFLGTVSKDDTELKQTLLSHFKEKFDNLPEKFTAIEEQLLQEFLPDDSFPLGAPLFMETPHSSIYAQKDDNCFDEEVFPSAIDDEDVTFEESGCPSDRRTSESLTISDVLNVNQLLESVVETARQVANLPVSSNPVPYDQMKSQCEALVIGKQQKMSVLSSFRHLRGDSRGSTEENSMSITESNEPSSQSEPDAKSTGKEYMRRCDSVSSESEQSFRLPPASPYDKFLKAAGW